MNKEKIKQLFSKVSTLSENLSFLSNTNQNLEQSWDCIAWDISRAANEIRDTNGLPDFDYSVLHSLKGVVYDTDQSVCAMKVLSPQKIQQALAEAFTRIQSFRKELDVLRGKLRQIVWTDNKTKTESKMLSREDILNVPDAPAGQRACDIPEKDKEFAEQFLKIRRIMYKAAAELTGEQKADFWTRALAVLQVTGLSIDDYNRLNQKNEILVLRAAAKLNRNKQREIIESMKLFLRKARRTGRKQKYSDDDIKRAMEFYDDDYGKSKDSKAAWSKTADTYGFKSREAARRTVTRRMKKLR